FLIGLVLLGLYKGAFAADPSIDFNNGTLTVRFGDEDATMRFSYDYTDLANAHVLLQQDPNNILQPGAPLIFNGQPVRMADVKKMGIYLGGGKKNLTDSNLLTDEIWLYAQNGSHVLKGPMGSKFLYFYGGPGSTFINAEHSAHSGQFFYGGDGDE